ncbi:MAG: ABC transporter permease [Cytophagales bacterium]|nr:ABC transporter permease [Armatimonadota bacterium]
MSFWESLRVAFSALLANKLRSLLTMLGVIIGVGSVIIMVAIVQGARQQIVQDFKGDGADVLFAVYAPKRGEQRTGGSFEGLTQRDAEAIFQRVPELDSIAPELETSLKAIRGKREFQANAIGVTDTYTDVTNLDVVRGRFVTGEDNNIWAKVCIIGDKVRTELFGSEDALGKTLVVQLGANRTPLTVVGILRHKERSGFGSNPDEQILLPLTTLQKRLSGTETLSQVSARADGLNVEGAADAVFAVLKSRHPDHAKDFIVDTQEGLLQRLDSVLIIFQLILGGVGGLSLLVGGIGIMNIMLVSVTERTREIGIRKAIGAKRQDILIQFVTESMVVSGLGGLLGCAFGYGVSKAISSLAGDKLPTFVPLWAAVMGFTFAVAVGMFFGIYPAVRASRLDPIDALRYE